MIRIEVIDPRGHYIKSLDFSKDEITLGRSLQCDVIVADFDIKMQELTVRRSPEGIEVLHHNESRRVKGRLKVRSHGYKFRVTDLNYFSSIEKFDHREKTWVATLGLSCVILLGVFLDHFVLTPQDRDVWDTSRDFMISVASIMIIVISFSLISRAVNGEYKIWRVANILLGSLILLAFYSENLFGSRWILPSFLHNEQIWILLLLGTATYFIWNMGETLFDHLSKKIKLIIMGVILFGTLVAYYSSFLPTRDRFSYVTRWPPPPLLQNLETSPVSQEDFLKEVESQLK